MPEVISRAESQPSGTDALVLATISFAVCFAAWGLIGASAPFWKIALQLTDSQKGVLVAVPVLLGSLARIPVGMLADRFGGRVVFSALMLVSAVPGALAPIVAVHYGFRAFVADGFFLGLAGSSFAVGVSFVSRWYPKAKQGTALGIYGIGNIGQSAAVFFGPVLAIALASRAGELGSEWAKVFYGTAAMLAVWALVFALAARNPPAAVRPANIAEMLHTLGYEPLAWALSTFYFLTFGGFVAFGIYLPSLLRDQFLLKPTDAGFRTAGFVVLAILTRPLGGWLSDRVGGARVLSFVLAGLVPFALLLAWPPEETGVNYVPVPFTLAALACAALLGFGNGAVFKLVPQYFPAQAGTMTGLVGAMGGLGGFFPPLLLGYFSDHFHTIWPGFALLAATAFALYMLNRGVFLAREKQDTARTEPRPSNQTG